MTSIVSKVKNYFFGEQQLNEIVHSFHNVPFNVPENLPLERLKSEFSAFPEDHELGLLSLLVYFQGLDDIALATFPDKKFWLFEETKYKCIKPSTQSWELLATAASGLSGYHGAAYFDVNLKHIVISSRGTELTNLRALEEDWTLFKKRVGPQVKSAYLFTQQIIQNYGHLAISISCTGHSLGGYLAQSSAFFIKYPDCAKSEGFNKATTIEITIKPKPFENNFEFDKGFHVHTVAFESPGVKEILHNSSVKCSDRYPLDESLHHNRLISLDITNYLSNPNFINTCGEQIGIVIHIQSGTTEKDGRVPGFNLFRVIPFINNTFASHSIDAIVKVKQQEEENEAETELKIVINFPLGLAELKAHHEAVYRRNFAATAVRTESIDCSIFKISIFNDDERQLLQNIEYLQNWPKKEGLGLKKQLEQSECQTLQFFKHFKIYQKFKFIHFGNSDDTDLTKSQYVTLVKYLLLSMPEINETLELEIANLQSNFRHLCELKQSEYMSTFVPVKLKVDSDTIQLASFLNSDTIGVLRLFVRENVQTCARKVHALLSHFRELENQFIPSHFTRAQNSLYLNSSSLAELGNSCEIGMLFRGDAMLFNLLVIEQNGEFELEDLLLANTNDQPELKKIIIVTKRNFENLPAEAGNGSGGATLEFQVGPDFETIHWNELTTLSELLNQTIIFQGNAIPLMSISEVPEDVDRNSGSVCDPFVLYKILKRERVSFGKSFNGLLSEFEASYYIPRTFQQLVLDERNCLKIVDKGCFILVTNCTLVNFVKLLGIKVELVLKLDMKSSTSRAEFLTGNQKYIVIEGDEASEEDVGNFIEGLANTAAANSRNIHWFRYELGSNNGKEYFVWQKLFGKVINPKMVKSTQLCFQSENELFESKEKLLILLDEPGMGKSTMMKEFAIKVKNRSTSNWAVFIDLNKEWGKFEPYLSSSNHNYNNGFDLSVVKSFIVEQERGEFDKDSVEQILSGYLQSNKFPHIHIFFDAFDEVERSIQEIVLKFQQILTTQTRAKVWIASRKQEKVNLETTSNTFVRMLVPLTESERIYMLTKYWTNCPEFRQLEFPGFELRFQDSIAAYAKRLLAAFEESINSKDSSRLVAIPQQLFLLAEISTQYFVQFCQSLSKDTEGREERYRDNFKPLFANIYTLYGEYFKVRYDKSFVEKCGFSQEHIRRNFLQFKTFRETLNRLHEKFAFQVLFPSAKNIDSGPKLNEDEELELIRVGIAEATGPIVSGKRELKFGHRTYAEYFAAQFIVTVLQRGPEGQGVKPLLDFLRQNLFIPHHHEFI